MQYVERFSDKMIDRFRTHLNQTLDTKQNEKLLIKLLHCVIKEYTLES